MHDAAADPGPDILLVGGGLANSLIAFRLSQLRPELSVRIVEAGARLGGNHTWSFFASDLTQAQHDWIAPFVVHRWPGYTVRFPAFTRRLSTGYLSITSDRLDEVLRRALPDRVALNSPVSQLRPEGVTFADGRVAGAGAVMDGRGPTATPDLALGFQKFVGLDVRLAAPHGLSEPVVMDAAVDQMGGYRFVYILPFDARTLLIEDTRYTDSDALDHSMFRQGVLDYATAQGWRIEEVLREEHGVLPVVLDGDLEAHFDRMGPVALSGLRAGLFHPTTGYSLPDCIRLADHIAANWRPGVSLSGCVRAHALRVWSSRGFYRLLDRMLFRAARPDRRYEVLQRFYRLPQPLIERFYAARASLGDKARILSGRPPVPVGAALACLIEKGRA
ncbi:MAG: lycopene cyclase [Caulobacterales bacterium 32-69-10]|nr:MAG: lycopene cyclase [Caulobacterales bacterium 32-69-10]